MNFRILKTFFLFFSISSLAQHNSIYKGEIIKDRQFLIDKNEMTACDDKGHFVSIRPHYVNGTLRNYYIEYFDDLNLTERQEIETENFTDILDVFIKENIAHVLIKERTNKSITIKFDLFDLNNRKRTSKKLIDVLKETDKHLYKSIDKSNSITLNYDLGYLLSIPFEKDKKIFTYLNFIDSNLNSTSAKIISPQTMVRSKNISYLNTAFHNGKAYVLFNVTDSDNGNFYNLIEVSEHGAKEEVIPLKRDTYELVNIQITDENYIICGLYSHQKEGAFEGILYHKLKLNTLTIVSSEFSEFKTKEAQEYFRGIFKTDRSIDIKNLFIDANDNIYLVGQCYKLRKHVAPVGIAFASFAIGSTVAYLTYNPISTTYKVYDDILISKLNENGKLIWDKVIELRETEQIESKYNQKDSSYAAYLENDQLNIILNGYINPKKDKLIIQQDKRNSKTNFYNINISEEGLLTPKILLKNSESEILFVAERSLMVNKKLYNLGQGNMKKQLLQLNL